ncbi:hypothetical protein F5Y16DRAFT_312284 [Xylariaceae sp. FL0255]|nr:hypothetical protein F5Y16DRAFT_312284 [Xylariaceae sp. FL0255]
MGNRDRSTLRSDSGYGDDIGEATPRCPTDHPLTLKGYDVGPASKLHVGDVFEFLWADSSEFEWEWKCLGYTRFIVLRHNKSHPHSCVCIPISTGGISKHEFAKPGIDSFQQGFVFASGDPNPGYEQPRGGPKLQYSAVGIELRPGRLRVKEDSRANYADIIEIDQEAQVMVVGDVVKYFDRVRRNVNKAFMRQILRTALEKYQDDKLANPQQVESIMSVDAEQGGVECRPTSRDADRASLYTLNECPTDDEEDLRQRQTQQARTEDAAQEPEPEPWSEPTVDEESIREQQREVVSAKERKGPHVSERRPSLPSSPEDQRSPLIPDMRRPSSPAEVRRPSYERRLSSAEEKRLRASREALNKPMVVLDRRTPSVYEEREREKEKRGNNPKSDPDYDLRSLHSVAMAGLK